MARTPLRERLAAGSGLLGLLFALGALASGCGSAGPPSGPQLFTLVPGEARVGEVVEMRGAGLGESQGDAWVSVGGVAAPIRAWASDRILFEVPQVGPGALLVVVNWPTERSRGLSFRLLP